MELINTFTVTKVPKTKARIFKDLKVGQRIVISYELKPYMGASGGNGHYAPTLKLNGEPIYLTDLHKQFGRGLKLED